mgnify:CR=1 FL=1
MLAERAARLGAEPRRSDEAAQEIVLKNYIHIGIAVDTEFGLIVPVIRDVDKKDLVQLAQELESLATKARERKVTGEELKGGTFTISNGGVFGSLMSTPIINPPQSAVLGLHRIEDRPVVRDGQVVHSPDASFVLSQGDTLLVSGAVEQVAAAEEMLRGAEA